MFLGLPDPDPDPLVQVTDPDPESDPDPLVGGTDPRIQIKICTKMSRIRNTDSKDIEITKTLYYTVF